MDAFIKMNKRVDVMSARSEGDKDSPVLRVNLYSRDGQLKTVPGTERMVSDFSEKCTGAWRYYSNEEGIKSPKLLAYTINGKLWFVDTYALQSQVIKEGMASNAYPKACQFRLGEQHYLFIVDGHSMWSYDGNESWIINDVTPKQSDGTNYEPIDIIEHLDRIFLLTEKQVLISANLAPTDFTDATDAIELIIGSGRGENRQFSKIDDRLYIHTTEGVFVLSGDTISAVASTFSIDLVDDGVRMAPGRSGAITENAFVYLGADRELYSFNGQSKEMLSYNEQLKNIINPEATYLEKTVAHYDSVDKRFFL